MDSTVEIYEFQSDPRTRRLPRSHVVLGSISGAWAMEQTPHLTLFNKRVFINSLQMLPGWILNLTGCGSGLAMVTAAVSMTWTLARVTHTSLGRGVRSYLWSQLNGPFSSDCRELLSLLVINQSNVKHVWMERDWTLKLVLANVKHGTGLLVVLLEE